jgi:DNA-binding CsgD family transcriptional regulator
MPRARGPGRSGADRVVASSITAFRGDAAVSNGWLQRAERLLAGLDPTPEHGWLHYRKAQAALFGDHDPAAAREHAAACRAIGRGRDCVDLEVGALALEGLAHVTEGDPAAGQRCLDEAMTAIVGGELTDLTIIGIASCHVIAACERTHDYDRAAQWCERLKEFSARWRIRPLFAVCRTLYAGICLSRGTWGDAEAELIAAASELADTHPAAVPEALARLGELRRRQGRLDEAAALFTDAEPHPLAVLGRAALALDQDRPLEARELVERYLRRVPPRDCTGRIAGLDLLVRAASALSDRTAAAVAAEELRAIATKLAADPIRAMTASSSGVLALADFDWDAARTAFEDAIDLFTRAGMPFEAARARLDRVRALESAGRRLDALGDARAAARIFETIGAVRDAGRATAVCSRLESDPGAPAPATSGASGPGLHRLTARERDVLKLVSEGLSNHQIAKRLGRSEHTVHRHVSNILTKLDLPSRAAAAAAAARSRAI